MFASAQPPNLSKHERGVMIVFEGLDRSGKTGQAQILAKKMTENGIPTEFAQFPNRNTETGKKINAFLTNQLELSDQEIHLLFSENRREVAQEMANKLKAGTSFIVDRYSYSGAVFTAAKNKPGMDLSWCFAPEVGLLAPDAVFYLNVSPEVQQKRGGFGAERYESVAFQANAREKFDRLIDLSPAWGTYKELHADRQRALAKAKQRGGEEEKSEEAKEEDAVAPEPITNFISPWYKVNADMEYNDVTLCVTSAAMDVYNIAKSEPMKFLGKLGQDSI